MADVHSKETRSYNMRRIRSKNTKPEIAVRKFLFANGYRFRLHRKDLPGKPDIVLPKYKTEDKDGEPHEPIFTISVSLKNKYKFKAQGKTKKEAEQKAAEEMLNFINNNDE